MVRGYGRQDKIRNAITREKIEITPLVEKRGYSAPLIDGFGMKTYKNTNKESRPNR